jgi:hypothetical protein
VCGSATAENSAFGVPPGGADEPTKDCYTDDNFATARTADPPEEPTVYVLANTDYPEIGGKPIDFGKDIQTPRHDTILVAWFHNFGADLDPAAITFTAPTTQSGPKGQSVLLPPIEPTDNKGPNSGQAKGIGYVVQSLTSDHRLQRFTPGAGLDVVIAYRVPDDGHLKVDGKTFTYTAKLHAQPVNAQPGQCGNATWTFTHDGKNVTTGGSTCGENSFWAFMPQPSDGKASPGTLVRAFYTDESPMQERDMTDPDPTWPPGDNYGIDFSITDVNGTVHQLNRKSDTNPNGYTTAPSVTPYIGREKFNRTIEYVIPAADSPYALPNGPYTVYLKAYDTDNNKPGNDCGVFTWTFRLTGSSGDISLVE